MAKVPDTDTFALSDVDVVLSEDSENGLFDWVTDSVGKAMLHGALNSDVVIGSRITITDSTYYNGTHTVTARTDTTITIDANYIDTDLGKWDLELYSLGDMFTAAVDNKFDWRYSVAKDRLSNFRNYGTPGTGVLTAGDHDDQAGYHWGLHGNQHWVFIACMEFGVRCYDVSTLGMLTLKNTAGAPGNEGFIDVWTQSSKLFLTSQDSVADVNYLRSYTYNTVTGVMVAADVIQASTETGAHHIFGDGSNLIFVTQPFGLSTYGIHSFTYDINGNLTFKDVYNADLAFYYKGVYVDGYLFVVGSNGITSFTRNITTGVLTRVDNDNTGTFVGNSIIYDSNSGLLFVGSDADGAIVYSHSSGTLTQEYRQGSGVRKHPAYHSAANYLYYIDGSNVLRYKRNVNDDLDYIGSQALGIVERLFIWSGAPNILIASDGYDGIRTYGIDYD